MNQVNVRKDKLLTILRENRESHRGEFEKAIDGWHRKVLVMLQNAVDEAKANKRFRTYFDLPEPKDYTDQYDEVIGMLEMHTGEEIPLTVQEYRNYVNDDWGWKDAFTTTNSRYV